MSIPDLVRDLLTAERQWQVSYAEMHPAPVHNDQTHVVVLCVWGAPARIRFCGVRACGTWVASGAFHGVELYGRTGSALRTTSTGSVRSADCLRAFPPRHNKKNLTQPPIRQDQKPARLSCG